jgi:hypothetical protein
LLAANANDLDTERLSITYTHLLSWDRMRLDPAIPVNTYHDSFGNFCHVIRAPAGRLTVSACGGFRREGREASPADLATARMLPAFRNQLGAHGPATSPERVPKFLHLLSRGLFSPADPEIPW